MRKLSLSLVLILLVSYSLGAQTLKSLHDFTVKTIEGRELALSSLKGKKVLVVNVASRCGLTPQYADLEELYRVYKDRGLVILGFPANNFKGQEPGTNAEIAEFCRLNYEVSFPMMEKISVKGDDIAPLYRWLTERALNGVQDAPIRWNFQKFMIDEEGHWVGVIMPRESVLSPRVFDWLGGSKIQP